MIIIKFIFVFLCLVIASYTDIKTREVSNNLWMFMLPFALLIFFFELVQIQLVALLSFILPTIVVLIAHKHTKFGGADAKAVIILSLFYPYCFMIPISLLHLEVGLITLILFYSIKNKFKFKKDTQYPIIPFLTIGFVIVEIILNLYI